jgi:putative oxidoreductase
MGSGDARTGEAVDMETLSSWTRLAGRLALGLIFLVSGAGKLAGWSGTVAYAGSKGIPAVLLAGAVAFEILGAISLMAGWKARWGAAALLVFLVPVTLVFHAFWAVPVVEHQAQMINFMKNLAIAGGLLSVLGAGPGALGVDGWRARAATNPAVPGRLPA